jgi:hypothetical protein
MSLNSFISSVPSQNAAGVNSFNSSLPSQNEDRPLSEHERDLMLRWCDRDSDSLILEARQLFNATIVAINPPAGANRNFNRHRLERQLTLGFNHMTL